MHKFWWSFVSKIVMTYCEKNCSSGQGKLLKSFRLVKDQNNFWNRMLFDLFLEVFQIKKIRTIVIQIGKKILGKHFIFQTGSYQKHFPSLTLFSPKVQMHLFWDSRHYQSCNYIILSLTIEALSALHMHSRVNLEQGLRFCTGSIHIWRQIFLGHFWPTYSKQILYYSSIHSQ